MLLISLNQFAINLVSNSLFLWLSIILANSRQTENKLPIALEFKHLSLVVFNSQLIGLYFAIPGVNYLFIIAASSYLIHLFSACTWRLSFLLALVSNISSLVLISLLHLVSS